MTNVLLITADQWRGDCVGVAGQRPVKTPNIDALAGQGTYFSRHYAGSAPCSPGRACLYTGLYQMNNRVCRNGTPLDSRHDTVALAARRAGYDPILFGYTDQGADPRTHAPDDPALRTYEGILPGFTARVLLRESEENWHSWLRNQGLTLPDPPRDIHLPVRGDVEPVSAEAPAYTEDQTQTAFLTDAFLDWLQEQTPGQPWFTHISFLRPHPPFIVPAPYNTMFDAATVDSPIDLRAWQDIASTHPFLRYAFQIWDKSNFIHGAEGPITDWSEDDLRQIKATYYGMIAEVDAQIGRIVDGLKKANAWDDTLIVLTTDHGEMLGDHRMLGKLGFYEQSFHVPLIIRDPAQPQGHGRTITHFTEAVDVTPTIEAAIGVQPAHPLDGKALQPFLRGETPDDWRKEAHWEYDFREVASQQAEIALSLHSEACALSVIRDERFKYVHFVDLPPLLFDLENDPNEVTNLADNQNFHGVRMRLAEKLLSWRVRHLDQRLALMELTPQGVVTHPSLHGDAATGVAQ